MIGCFGEVNFQTDKETIITPSEISYRYRATYGNHARASGRTLVDFAGLECENMTVKIPITDFLGANVQEYLAILRRYERLGLPQPYVQGDQCYGLYRWVIESMDVKETAWAANGRCVACEVTLNLLEYVKS